MDVQIESVWMNLTPAMSKVNKVSPGSVNCLSTIE
jgi:hypothetical protein